MNLNKYHSTGRLYTAKESQTRAEAIFAPKFLVAGYSADMLKQVEQRRLGQCKPHDIGRNAAKRQIRALGYKSLKQYHRQG